MFEDALVSLQIITSATQAVKQVYHSVYGPVSQLLIVLNWHRNHWIDVDNISITFCSLKHNIMPYTYHMDVKLNPPFRHQMIFVEHFMKRNNGINLIGWFHLGFVAWMWMCIYFLQSTDAWVNTRSLLMGCRCRKVASRNVFSHCQISSVYSLTN